MEINLEDISFGYGSDTIVLNGISLNMAEPQVISILGPNGVGKSTLIHCINKILQPTKGTVLLDGTYNL